MPCELALAAVAAWSRRIHDAASDRHRWCVNTARAVLTGQPLPPAGPGTPDQRTGTAKARRETIHRLLEHTP